MKLKNKKILITGAAKRIGRILSLLAAREGGEVLIHHNSSPQEADSLLYEIQELGQTAEIIQADFSNPASTAGPGQKVENSLEMQLKQARTWEKAGDEKYSAEQYDAALKLYKIARNAYRELGRSREVTALDHKINDTINQKLLFQIKRGIKELGR